MSLAINHRTILFASLISAVYFAMLFFSFPLNLSAILYGALVELCTLPLIFLQGFIIFYVIRSVFVQKNRISIEMIVPLIISTAIFVFMFTVK